MNTVGVPYQLLTVSGAQMDHARAHARRLRSAGSLFLLAAAGAAAAASLGQSESFLRGLYFWLVIALVAAAGVRRWWAVPLPLGGLVALALTAAWPPGVALLLLATVFAVWAQCLLVQGRPRPAVVPARPPPNPPAYRRPVVIRPDAPRRPARSSPSRRRTTP